MWRVRLWSPYSSMPIGLGILALQYVVELYCLVSGREPPFGIGAERAP
jgi:TRAP-type C4-dicarboxylate transport system permease small subunit